MFIKCGLGDSNSQPPSCKDGTLPVELSPHIFNKWTLWELNPPDFLFAKQVTTPCSPKAHIIFF